MKRTLRDASTVLTAKAGGPVYADCADCGWPGPHDSNGDTLDPQASCSACGSCFDVRSANKSPAPGMPATYCIGSDQYPVTITRVSDSGATVWYSRDVQVGANMFLTGAGEDGPELKATLRQDGTYRPVGRRAGYLHLGERGSYRDPSF